jgi:hypothetical protein
MPGGAHPRVFREYPIMPEKSQSPFYPGQPVPVELFVGREQQIDRILTRGGGQVERGKPVVCQR